jgi:hypothetical protein
LSAKLSNGSDFPSWLKFNDNNNTFIWTPTYYDIGKILTIQVNATDDQGDLISTSFILEVLN